MRVTGCQARGTAACRFLVGSRSSQTAGWGVGRMSAGALTPGRRGWRGCKAAGQRGCVRPGTVMMTASSRQAGRQQRREGELCKRQSRVQPRQTGHLPVTQSPPGQRAWHACRTKAANQPQRTSQCADTSRMALGLGCICWCTALRKLTRPVCPRVAQQRQWATPVRDEQRGQHQGSQALNGGWFVKVETVDVGLWVQAVRDHCVS